MYTVFFDSGTSNSRVYLLDNQLELIATDKQNIGSSDSALAGSNLVLIDALKSLYDSVLEKSGVCDSLVEDIYASGMVTSPYGLEEIPHLLAPQPLTNLRENLHTHREMHRFNRDIHLIRGVRTGGKLSEININNIEHVNNMRGEEIELLGILSSSTNNFIGESSIVINPGSHTHISYVRQGILEDIFSTFTGEFYHAISKKTILAGAIEENSAPDYDAAWQGYKALERYGINRALYICHSQKLFGVGSGASRKSFLEGVISGDMVSAIAELSASKWQDAQKIFVAQSGDVSKYLVYLLKKAIPNVEVIELKPKDSVSFALCGIKELLRPAL